MSLAFKIPEGFLSSISDFFAPTGVDIRVRLKNTGFNVNFSL